MAIRKKRKPITKKPKRAAAKRRGVKQAKEPKSGSLKSTLDIKVVPARVRTFVPDDPGADRPNGGALSGDLQGLETDELEANESVAELADEGQDLEAEEVEAIETAPDPDQSELKPRKTPRPIEPNEFKDRNRI